MAFTALHHKALQSLALRITGIRQQLDRVLEEADVSVAEPVVALLEYTLSLLDSSAECLDDAAGEIAQKHNYNTSGALNT